MKIRIAFLAACASTLTLALAAGTFSPAFGSEKTFLGGDASKGIKKSGPKGGTGRTARPQTTTAPIIGLGLLGAAAASRTANNCNLKHCARGSHFPKSN
jgi:hypothetical protein